MKPISTFQELVTLDGDKLVTDSLILAKTFKKHHKNVLQSYDKLKCSAEFKRLNFQPFEYIGEQGKTSRSVTMTKDGFTMLAMGFAGEGAMWHSRRPTSMPLMQWPPSSPTTTRTCGSRCRHCSPRMPIEGESLVWIAPDAQPQAGKPIFPHAARSPDQHAVLSPAVAHWLAYYKGNAPVVLPLLHRRQYTAGSLLGPALPTPRS